MDIIGKIFRLLVKAQSANFFFADMTKPYLELTPSSLIAPANHPEYNRFRS
jgi:hypothetical protein